MSRETNKGLGKVERRRMKACWKASGSPLTLKVWARQQHPVGEAAYYWLEAKLRGPKAQP